MTHRLREQARSHTVIAVDHNPVYTANPCGSEPARDCVSSGNIEAE